MSDTTPPPPPPPPPAGYAGGAAQPMSPQDEKLWSTLIHIGGIFFGFIPSLIGYLVLKDRGPFIAAHTKTALNFQITMTIAYVVGWILTFVIIGIILVIAVAIVVVIFSIIAAMKANAGEQYSYPLSIKFVK